MKKFWDFAMKNDSAELHFYGEIADTAWSKDDVTPKRVQEDLDSVDKAKDVNIYINSPGGDVFAGLAIYTMITRLQKPTTVHVDGLAASAASVIAMAGDRIVMPKSSVMMIHNAWTFSWGNKEEIRETADKLERIDNQLAKIYADRTGRDIETVKQMMKDETWMDGDEAFAAKFCDEVEENKKVAACADPEVLARYKHAPKLEATPEEQKKSEEEPRVDPEGPKDEPEDPAEDNDNREETQPTAEVEARKHRLSIKHRIMMMEE